jgi:hypothetical protein
MTNKPIAALILLGADSRAYAPHRSADQCACALQTGPAHVEHVEAAGADSCARLSPYCSLPIREYDISCGGLVLVHRSRKGGRLGEPVGCPNSAEILSGLLRRGERLREEGCVLK